MEEEEEMGLLLLMLFFIAFWFFSFLKCEKKSVKMAGKTIELFSAKIKRKD